MAESLVALRDRREKVITRISECYANDVLEVDELERRLDLAHAAASVAELDALVADLAPAPAASTALATQQHALVVDDPNRPDAKKLRVVMSAIERRGRWTVPKATNLSVFWGSAELDFRDASLGSGVTTIHVGVTMGSLEIVVPPWLAVDVDVSSFMGSVEERHRVPSSPDPDRPILRIVGAVRLGSLEIETRLPGESRRDARKRERKQRKALRGRAQRALPPGRADM
jgi:hypothetical protein